MTKVKNTDDNDTKENPVDETDYSTNDMVDLKDQLRRRNIRHDADAPREDLIKLLEKADAAWPDPIDEAKAEEKDDDSKEPTDDDAAAKLKAAADSDDK